MCKREENVYIVRSKTKMISWHFTRQIMWRNCIVDETTRAFFICSNLLYRMDQAESFAEEELLALYCSFICLNIRFKYF